MSGAGPPIDSVPVNHVDGGLAAAGPWRFRALSLERRLAEIIGAVCLLAVLGCFSVMTISVFFRYVLNDSLVWAEEVARWLLMAIAFLGAGIAMRRGEHIGFHHVLNRVPGRPRAVIQCGIAQLVAVFALLVVYVEWTEYVPVRMAMALPATGLPEAVFAIPVMVGMLTVFVFATLGSLTVAPRLWVASLAVVLLGASLVALFGADAVAALGVNPLAVAWIVCLILILIGVPTAFALGLGGCSYLLLEPGLPLFFLAQHMESGVNSFVLLAIPLFVLVGKLQESTSVSDRLLDLVKLAFGRLRGGMGLVTVGGMYLFSGISGSLTADVSAVGSVVMAPLRRQGFSDGEAVGILSASTVMGHTIPPSLGIIVLAQIANLSVGALFIAGIIPASTLALVLGGVIIVRAYMQKLERNPPLAPRERLRVIRRGLPSLIIPVVLFGGLFSGVVTPTEVAALAVLTALLIAGLGLRELSWRNLATAAIDSASLTGVALMLLAAANVIGFASVNEGLPQGIAQWVAANASRPWEFLLLSFAVLIVMGAVLEFPALFIFGPLLVPVAATLGFHPIHYAICLLIAVTIGHFVPPFGVLFYVACSVTGARTEGAVLPTVFYLAFNVIGLAIVALVPWLTLALPQLLGLVR